MLLKHFKTNTMFSYLKKWKPLQFWNDKLFTACAVDVAKSVRGVN